MKVAFIGQNGHHYLRGLLKQEGIESAGAGDGYTGPGAETPRKSIETGRWFDDAREMFDVFKPDVVSIGAVYGYNGKWILS